MPYVEQHTLIRQCIWMEGDLFWKRWYHQFKWASWCDINGWWIWRLQRGFHAPQIREGTDSFWSSLAKGCPMNQFFDFDCFIKNEEGEVHRELHRLIDIHNNVCERKYSCQTYENNGDDYGRRGSMAACTAQSCTLTDDWKERDGRFVSVSWNWSASCS